jgi:hypothetical protein
MTVPGAFGSASHYYSYSQKDFQEARRSGRGFHDQEVKLKKLLSKEVPERVARCVTQWNQAVRDLIRSESALRLKVGDFRQTVPIKIYDGLPLPFAKVVEDVDEIQLWLTLHRQALESTEAGLGLVNSKLPDLCEWSYQLSQAALFDINKPFELNQSSLMEAQKFLEALLKVQKTFSLERRLQEIDEDILGAYFFRIPEIQLYWMVIGFFAKYLKVPEEALTIVVLAHELAHAYTHRGLDIDGRGWTTKAFAETDLFIVEGLAQFYTEVVCKRLALRFPLAFQAYEELLKIQGGPYHAHRNWSTSETRTGEAVRMTLLHTRTNRVSSYEEFKKMLDWARKSLTRNA